MSVAGPPPVINRRDRPLMHIVTGAICLAVLMATLTPATHWDDAKKRIYCVGCGQGAASDVLVNSLLLLPLGFCLSLAGVRGHRTAAAAAALSITIEATQSLIPGRAPNIGDVLFNVTGAVIGWMLFRRTAVGQAVGHALVRGIRCLVFPSRRLEPWLSFGAAACVVGLVLVAYLLFTPDLPEGVYVVGTGALDRTNGPLYLGGNPREDDFLRGTMDEVRIFRSTRSGSEIREDMKRPVSQDDPGVAARAGLIAAYDFEQSAPGIVTDVSGRGHDGVVSRAVYVQGKFGQGLEFSGNAQGIVTIPHSPELDLVGAMTIESWVNPAGPQRDWGNIVQKDGDAYFLTTSSDAGPLRPAGGGSFGGELDSLKSPQPIPSGVWTHLAMTYDGHTFVLYVNGDAIAANQRWSSARLLEASLGSVNLGMWRPEWSADFRAQLGQGAPLRVRFEPLSWHDTLAPLVRIRDQRREDVLFVAIESADVVLRSRVVAARFGFHVPAHRVQGALFRRDPNNGSLLLSMSRKHKSYYLEVGGDATYRVGFGLASGWTLLIDSASVSPWLERLLDFIWLGVMCFAVGFCTFHRRTSYAALVLLALVFTILPGVGGFPALTGPLAICGLVAVVSGRYCRVVVQDALRALS